MPAGRRKRTGGDPITLPAVRPDLDRTPARIGEVEIDAAGLLGEADMDRPLGSIELGAGLEQIERRTDLGERSGPPRSPRSGGAAANPAAACCGLARFPGDRR